MLELFALIVAFIMGTVLGSLGGGGSLLTVPIFVYLLKYDAVHATWYSLVIVAVTSSLGLFLKWREKLINFKLAFLFGVPSAFAAYFVRANLTTLVPETVYTGRGWTLDRSSLIMLCFGLIALSVGMRMIKDQRQDAEAPRFGNHFADRFRMAFLLCVYGLGVGALLGFMGAGGGFLIVPALMYLGRTGMREAIATSLFLVATNSLIGFLGGLDTGLEIPWASLALISAAACAGMWMGHQWSRKMKVSTLRPLFGYFIVLMGILIVIREIFAI